MTTTAADTPDRVDAWLKAAVDDARRRDLADLVPLLEGLAASTRQLRAADWNDLVPAVERLDVAPGKTGGVR
jgi:hypothetical protein